jgi:hypothetical protein
MKKFVHFEVSFDDLITEIESMVPVQKKFTAQLMLEPLEFVDSSLEQGLELGVDIHLNDIESDNPMNLLQVNGSPVMIYIPDHSFNFDNCVDKPSMGKKVHFAECNTVSKMREQNRIERYTVTNQTTGLFKVYRYATYQKDDKPDANIKLNPCKNCLKAAGYDNYNRKSLVERDEFIENFDYKNFLRDARFEFDRLPKVKVQADFQYSNNWKSISFHVRKRAKFCCQKCRVDLQDDRKCLHTHHKNGLKGDNSRQNLVALCADCHSQEDHHQHMLTSHSDVILETQRIKQAQGILV